MKIGITERGDAAIDLTWVKWVNKGKPAILISKNLEKLYRILVDLENPNIIVHCNITGYGGSVYEPNVPVPENSLAFLEKIVEKLGKDRIVLRIDPIFTEKEFVKKSLCVKNWVDKHIPGLRCRISFVDNYKHIQQRFKELGLKELDYNFHESLEIRKQLWEVFGKPDTCGEPGLPSVGCISEIDCKILGVEPETGRSGQRKECTCLSNKKELLLNRNPCIHNCRYCYWKDKD